MFINNLDPIAITIFNIDIRWYSLAYIFGLILAIQFGKFLIKKNNFFNFSSNILDEYLPFAIIGIILGGRLGYILFYDLNFFLQNPINIFFIWEGGMSFHGGMLGVIVSVILYAQRHKVSLLSLGDAIAIAAPIGLFFGRLANFINGELWGRVSDVPWAIVFPQVELYARAYPELAATLGQGRHPSQLYEAALEGLVLFLVLAHLAWRTDALKRPGTLIGTFLVGYGLARAFCEFFRMPDVGIGFDLAFGSFGISRGQLLCLPMIIAGLLFLKYAQGAQSTQQTT